MRHAWVHDPLPYDDSHATCTACGAEVARVDFATHGRECLTTDDCPGPPTNAIDEPLTPLPPTDIPCTD